MRARFRAAAVFGALASGWAIASVIACSSSSNPAQPVDGGSTPDGTTTTSSSSSNDASSSSSSDAAADGATTDAGTGATATYVADFGDAGPNPEGLYRVGNADTPIVGYAFAAQLAVVTPDGGTQLFGSIAVGDSGATNSFTLGVITDNAGNVYTGVAAYPVVTDGGNVPPPGVYKFPPDGGPGTLFSSSPQMKFANGFVFVGSQLFVADSYGYVLTIAPDGGAAVWSSDPLLAPDAAACNSGVGGLTVGANGIVSDSNNANVYVTNSNFGRLIQIPIEADGSAGTATAVIDSCAFVGADGLALDPTNGTFLVALNSQNTIARAALDGGVTVVSSGSPLHTPASVLIDLDGGARRLLITNATFFSGTGDPGLLEVPIPSQ